jgi:hypothetical protein
LAPRYLLPRPEKIKVGYDKYGWSEHISRKLRQAGLIRSLKAQLAQKGIKI